MVKTAVLSLFFLLMNCTSYYHQQFDFYYRINDWESAEKILLEGLASDPGNSEIYFLLGQVYGHEGNFDEMDQAFNRSISLSKRHSMEIIRLREFFVLQQLSRGVEAYNAGDYERAIDELNWVSIIKNEEQRHYKHLGLAYSKLKNYGKARNNLELSVKYTDDLDSRLELARVYHLLGDSQGVLDITEEILRTFPSRLDVLILRAIACERLERFSDAVATYYEILKLDPSNIASRYNLALLLSQTGKQAEAIPYLEQLYLEDPGNDSLKYKICTLLYDTSQYEECLDCFLEYSVVHPGDKEVLEYMFVLNRKLHNWEGAKTIRQQLKEFDTAGSINTE